MHKFLIVSPHFPPANTPDMQRVRMSLPYFHEFGWDPVVLAVRPDRLEWGMDPFLLQTIPRHVPVYRVSALSPRWTRRLGVGDVGLRAWPYLYQAGARLIGRHQIRLVYFSTTVFFSMPLARFWKRRFGLPTVLDFQDPWAGDYYSTRPGAERPSKYWLSRRLHALLEPWTLEAVDGIVAVCSDYHELLCRRYPWLNPQLCRTIPFGASLQDSQWARSFSGTDPLWPREDGLTHGVYAGVLGPAMKPACTAICLAFKEGLDRYPELFSRVRLHFCGTDYAVGASPRRTIQPIAEALGVGRYIQEDPHRQPYSRVLKLLDEADFLILPGSDNPQYTASKIYPCIAAEKPLLALFHRKSSVVEVLESTRAGQAVAFSSGTGPAEMASALLAPWVALLRRLPFRPQTDWEVFHRYTAREMTRQQCELFDRVLQVREEINAA